MKYYNLKRRFVLFMVCCIAFLLTACYEVKTIEKNEYVTFRTEMQSKNNFIYTVLPALNSEENIDDIYLYYSDRDLLDSFYTVYLNCVYSEERYIAEQERLLNVSDEATMLSNTSSFEYDAIVFQDSLEFYATNMIFMNYAYALFDEENSKIIYVMIFQKTNNATITNIPEKYLPKEYLSQIQK